MAWESDWRTGVLEAASSRVSSPSGRAYMSVRATRRGWGMRGNMRMLSAAGGTLLVIALAIGLYAAPTLAAGAPPLGGASGFAVLAGSAVDNASFSVINGSVGVSP